MAGENTKYEGKIGNVTISVNNDGVWEHESYEDFKVEISWSSRFRN